MANNYNVIHCHSQYSLLDSATKYTDYVDKCVILGQKAIAFTEHGNIYNWISKKRYCEANGIKYIHGCEVYLTEALEPKVKDNYHTVLLAKNYEGVKELNSLISNANKEDHFYYKPRITFDEFLGISDNIISTSACMASPLNKLPEDNPYYEKLCRKYTFYEIQPHYHLEQMAFNKKLMLLHLKYGTPLIVGTDTHSIDEYRGECRKILQKAKKIEYADEDAFDLSYKSYDELREMFQKQHSLAMEIVDEALENTLKLADMCEEWELDMSFKYPRMSDNDIETFDKKVDFMFKEKIATGVIPESQKDAFIQAIEEEKAVFKKLDMCSFMLFMSELMMWCNDNGVVHGFARGSVAGSRIAYILDIIDINPEQWHTVFSRFCNEDRMEIGDIDSDFPDEQRGLVYDYIIKRFGENNAMYILALGTLKDKSTIDEIGRALGYDLNLVDTIKKEYEQEAETDPDTPEVRKKYPELFYYFNGLLDCTVSQSIHPAGIVASPITLSDNYGCFINSKDGKVTLQIDMEDVHESGLVKYDILGLNTIQIIADTCKLAGIPYPKSHEIDWNDQAVWQNMQTFPTGIFQMESSFAFKALKQFNPTSIFDMSLITASIRPSGASYRDKLLAREEHKNPSPLIDNLLKDNLGYLIYQEDVIAFLQQICGMTGSEADNLRRAIARKQIDRLEKALPQVLDGYCSKSDQPREVAEEEAKEFIQVIQDASSYMFG